MLAIPNIGCKHAETQLLQERVARWTNITRVCEACAEQGAARERSRTRGRTEVRTVGTHRWVSTYE